MGAKAEIWVLGCGQFGRRALEVLRRNKPETGLFVVDPDPAALAAVQPLGVGTWEGDGVEFTVQNLKADTGPEWIIPSLPLHLAYLWLWARLGPRAEPLRVPAEFAAALPNPRPASEGGFTISYAEFTCPPDCPEPAETCTYTGQPRKGNLFEDLARIPCPGHTVLVLRSHQLVPGLGGYRREELFALERRVLATGGRLVLATACRCHGVLHGLRVK